jgi:hypothetical protein
MEEDGFADPPVLCQFRRRMCFPAAGYECVSRDIVPIVLVISLTPVIKSLQLSRNKRMMNTLAR